MKRLKEEFDKLTFKDFMLHLIAVLTWVAAFTLLFLGMFIAPEGEIHDSVLTAFGIALFFIASIYGIAAFFVSQLTGFKTTILELLSKHNIKIDNGEGDQ